MHGLCTNSASVTTARSILPKTLEPIGAELRIAHRVRDVFVAEVLLDRACVLALAGEFEPARMAQHMRMGREGEFRELAGARDQFPRRRRRHRPSAFGHKQIRRIRVIAAQLAQRPELRPADRMRRGEAILQSRDVHQAGLEVDLLPAHRHEFRDPQPMPVSQEDERPIARTVAAHLDGGLEELLDLRRREILAGAPIKIRLSSWGDRRGGGRSRSRLWCLPIASS